MLLKFFQFEESIYLLFRGGARSRQGDVFSDQRGNLEASLQHPFQCLTMTMFVTMPNNDNVCNMWHVCLVSVFVS